MYGKSHSHPEIYSLWEAVIPASATDLQLNNFFLNIMKFNTSGSGKKLIPSVMFSSTHGVEDLHWLKNWDGWISSCVSTADCLAKKLTSRKYQRCDKSE